MKPIYVTPALGTHSVSLRKRLCLAMGVPPLRASVNRAEKQF